MLTKRTYLKVATVIIWPFFRSRKTRKLPAHAKRTAIQRSCIPGNCSKFAVTYWSRVVQHYLRHCLLHQGTHMNGRPWWLNLAHCPSSWELHNGQRGCSFEKSQSDHVVLWCSSNHILPQDMMVMQIDAQIMQIHLYYIHIITALGPPTNCTVKYLQGSIHSSLTCCRKESNISDSKLSILSNAISAAIVFCFHAY